MKILVTADGHHSKLIINKNEECISFINDLLIKERPSIFVHAGDLNDSQNLRSGSEEMRSLIRFIKATVKTANSIGCKYIILRGTKGHDGDVIKTIHDSISEGEYTFEYIDKPELREFNGRYFLFLPEMYVPTYTEFESVIEDTIKGIQVDTVFFHGMFDFAIPQLRQIDSSYGLSRSVVIDSNRFRRYFKLCAVGGHVHAQIRERNIIYTDSMINSIENTNMSLGIGRLVLHTNTYDYDTIPNPYNIVHKFIYLDFTRRTWGDIDDEVNKLQSEYNFDYIIFNAIVDVKSQTLSNYSTFIKKYSPKHIKKKMVEVKQTQKTIEYKSRASLSPDDIYELIMSISKNKYQVNLEQKNVIEVLNNKKGD